MLYAAGAYMNGARHESPFTLGELDATSAEQQQQSSPAPQQSENGNGNGSGSQHSTRGMDAPRSGENLDSMDASDLWLDAGECVLSPCLAASSTSL